MDTAPDTNNPSPIKKKTKSKNEKKIYKSILKCCLEFLYIVFFTYIFKNVHKQINFTGFCKSPWTWSLIKHVQ